MRVADRTHRWSLLSHRRVPRTLHPVAWWIWASGWPRRSAGPPTRSCCCWSWPSWAWWWPTAAARRRGPGPSSTTCTWPSPWWSSGCVFRSVFGGDIDARTMHVLFTLPHIPLPSWAAGVQLGGPVTLEGTLSALYDGLRLGTLLCCLGAANTLANPKRALRVLPGALYELGVAVVVALSVAPQLVESVQRVRRARKLRGGRHRGPPRPAHHRHSGARGRPRTLAAPGGGHGLPRLRPHRPASPAGLAGSPGRSCSWGCAACASAPTACSTAPRHGCSVCPPCSADRCCAASAWRSAAAACAAPSTDRTPGSCPSGWWPSPGWYRPWCSSPGAVSGRPASTPRPIR